MTTRTDIDLDLFDSPRVLEVRSPSTEMLMQDLVDTARKLEDAFSGMGFDKLVDAAGKQELSAGKFVGITVAMQNLLLSFAARTTPAETGTVTTNPGSPITGRDVFTDSGALFQTNNVARGSLVINFTDQSIADVVSVDSETQLTTKDLVNGIGNTYDASDVYHVFNVVQCRASSGNLTAVDDMQAAIAAVLPTAFTQVVIELDVSASLVESGVSGLTAGESAQLSSIASTTTTLRKLMQNRMETDPVTGVMTIYDDDDSTPLLTGNIYEDVLAGQLYRGRGMERRNRLT